MEQEVLITEAKALQERQQAFDWLEEFWRVEENDPTSFGEESRNDDKTVIWVAKQADQILGVSLLYTRFRSDPNRKNYFQVGSTGVTDRYRRQGIGRAMVEKSIAIAKQAGANQVFVLAGSQAVAFYQVFGFVESDFFSDNVREYAERAKRERNRICIPMTLNLQKS